MKELPVFTKKVRRLEEFLPRHFARHDFFGDQEALLKLFLHDSTCRHRHVERRVLMRIGRRDNRH